MSYAIGLSAPVPGNELRAAFDETIARSFPVAGDGSIEVPAEVRDHLQAGIAAAEMWLVPIVGHRAIDLYTLSINGHANPGHWPAAGWSDEFITISLRVTPGVAATQAPEGAAAQDPTSTGTHEPPRDIPNTPADQPTVPAAEVAANQPDTNPAGTLDAGPTANTTPLHPLQAGVPDNDSSVPPTSGGAVTQSLDVPGTMDGGRDGTVDGGGPAPETHQAGDTTPLDATDPNAPQTPVVADDAANQNGTTS